MFGANHTSKPKFFVFENADGGNLAQFFAGGQNRDQPWGKFGQVAEALEYMHNERVEHGGLKCCSILLTEDGVVKLPDKGQQRWLSEFEQQQPICRWMAPELLRETAQPCDFRMSDVFSLGLCVIEAVTGEIPYGLLSDDEVEEVKISGARVERPCDGFTDEEWELVSRMTAYDPDDRPSARELVKMMASLDWYPRAQGRVPGTVDTAAPPSSNVGVRRRRYNSTSNQHLHRSSNEDHHLWGDGVLFSHEEWGSYGRMFHLSTDELFELMARSKLETSRFVSSMRK